jgi:hypothetical protein
VGGIRVPVRRVHRPVRRRGRPCGGPDPARGREEAQGSEGITGLGIITVVAGWILWLRDLNDYGSLGDWLGSNFGLVLTIGAVLATIAAFLGALGVGRNVERLVDMSDTVAASGGPPTPEQQARIEHLGGEIEKHGKIDLVLLLLAVACMAMARYW